MATKQTPDFYGEGFKGMKVLQPLELSPFVVFSGLGVVVAVFVWPQGSVMAVVLAVVLAILGLLGTLGLIFLRFLTYFIFYCRYVYAKQAPLMRTLIGVLGGEEHVE